MKQLRDGKPTGISSDMLVDFPILDTTCLREK